MLTNKKLSLLGLAAACWLVAAPAAQAETFSDTGAAVLVWPKIVVGENTDTLVQITNQSNVPVAAHCFYVNANSRCTNTGLACASSAECQEGGFFGACLPGWIEVNFDIFLTANQPLAWSAEAGLSGSDLPCPGGLFNTCTGPGTNAGTRIPPVGETPFIGELKCIQSDPITRLPAQCDEGTCRNDLEGGATITRVDGDSIDPRRYNAVGLRTAGANDGNNVLVIGGEEAEYQACAEVLILNHLFDGAGNPIGDGTASSELTLVPCTEDFLTQSVPRVTAQFLVYNEFEQRFSTSRLVECLFDGPISRIDTSQPTRSIFSAAVSGTVAGQTRITGVGGGLIGSATLAFDAEGGEAGSGYNLNQAGFRAQADIIRIP